MHRPCDRSCSGIGFPSGFLEGPLGQWKGLWLALWMKVPQLQREQLLQKTPMASLSWLPPQGSIELPPRPLLRLWLSPGPRHLLFVGQQAGWPPGSATRLALASLVCYRSSLLIINFESCRAFISPSTV